MQALQGPPANLINVRPQVPAFGSNFAANLGSELARAALAAAQPYFDPDAVALASQVKRDPALALVRLNLEQLNLIGYSGGATVAFDAAVILQRYGISINNIVTLGGFVLRGKPGNAITWTSIIGDQDLIALSGAAPDASYIETNVGHVPIGTLPSYVTGAGIAPTVRIIHLAGLQ